MRTNSFPYVLTATLATLIGCGGGSDSVSTTISAAEGGSVELDGTRLDIPAAALAADTEVSMRVAEFAGPALDNAFQDLLVIEPESTALAVPAALTLALGDPGDADLVEAYQLIDGGWSRLEAELGSGGVVHTSVTSFGQFAIVIVPDVGTGSRIEGTLKWPNGEAAAEAPVELHRDGARLTEDVTDAQGGFGFVDLEPGSYHLIVNFECSLDRPVTVADGVPAVVDLVLCGAS